MVSLVKCDQAPSRCPPFRRVPPPPPPTPLLQNTKSIVGHPRSGQRGGRERKRVIRKGLAWVRRRCSVNLPAWEPSSPAGRHIGVHSAPVGRRSGRGRCTRGGRADSLCQHVGVSAAPRWIPERFASGHSSSQAIAVNELYSEVRPPDNRSTPMLWSSNPRRRPHDAPGPAAGLSEQRPRPGNRLHPSIPDQG